MKIIITISELESKGVDFKLAAEVTGFDIYTLKWYGTESELILTKNQAVKLGLIGE